MTTQPPVTFASVVPSLIRTYVPIVVGALLSWLVSAEVIPTPLPEDAEAGMVTAITAVLIGGYYTLVRLAERKWPQATILLGSTKQPAAYSPNGKGGYVTGQTGRHRDLDGDGQAG